MYSNVGANKRNTVLIILGFVALIALLGFLLALAYNDWSIALGVLIIATAYAGLQYFIASKEIVAMTGARKITKPDNPRLYNIVENLTLTAGLPMPEVYIMDDPAPNAFAAGRDPEHALVCATSGLLNLMDDKQLTAVMAHEISHIKNYDIRVSTIVFGLVCLVGLIADLGWRFAGSNTSDSKGDDDSSPMTFLIILATSLLAPLIAGLAQMAVSREREYLADSSAALLTRYPEGMISALAALEKHSQPMRIQNPATEAMFINNPLSSKQLFSSLFSTHPPIAKRIERLKNAQTKF